MTNFILDFENKLHTYRIKNPIECEEFFTFGVFDISKSDRRESLYIATDKSFCRIDLWNRYSLFVSISLRNNQYKKLELVGKGDTELNLIPNESDMCVRIFPEFSYLLNKKPTTLLNCNCNKFFSCIYQNIDIKTDFIYLKRILSSVFSINIKNSYIDFLSLKNNELSTTNY